MDTDIVRCSEILRAYLDKLSLRGDMVIQYSEYDNDNSIINVCIHNLSIEFM